MKSIPPMDMCAILDILETLNDGMYLQVISMKPVTVQIEQYTQDVFNPTGFISFLVFWRKL